jgi:hypothetical protein
LQRIEIYLLRNALLCLCPDGLQVNIRVLRLIYESGRWERVLRASAASKKNHRQNKQNSISLHRLSCTTLQTPSAEYGASVSLTTVQTSYVFRVCVIQ